MINLYNLKIKNFQLRKFSNCLQKFCVKCKNLTNNTVICTPDCTNKNFYCKNINNYFKLEYPKKNINLNKNEKYTFCNICYKITNQKCFLDKN